MPRNYRHVLKFAVFLLFLLAPLAVRAQGRATGIGTGIVHGQVVDPQHGALPGVTVTASSREAAGAPSSVVSDGEGKFELSLLPGRVYTITADLSGFSSYSRPEVTVAAGQSLALDIQLQVGGLSETITVLGQEVTRSRNTIERVQDVPLSISVVTGTELEKTEATGIAAITQRAANVSWNLGNQRTSSLSIRGVGRQGPDRGAGPERRRHRRRRELRLQRADVELRLHRRRHGRSHARPAGHAAGQEHEPGRGQRDHQAARLHADRRCAR